MAYENQEAIDFLVNKGLVPDGTEKVTLSTENGVIDFGELLMEFGMEYYERHDQGCYGRQDY